LTSAHLSGSEREHNKATGRILRVLSAFASDAQGFGVTELAQQLGMTKNMVYRALTTLVEQGYLIRDASSARYELGFCVLELQNPTQAEPDFRALCIPFIHRIADLTGESVSLTVRAQDFTVFVEGVETRKPGAYRTQVGALRPLHDTASGRVTLAFLDDKEIVRYMARHKPMRVTRPDGVLRPAELWRDIAVIRERGFLTARRGDAPPMASAAFPISDAEGRLHGVLAVGGPEERFGDELARLMPQLQDIVGQLRRRTRLYSATSAGSENG